MEVLHWYCMWGYFSAAGTDDVDCVPGIMESQKDHFKQDVMASVDKFHFDGHWTFNIDNKPSLEWLSCFIFVHTLDPYFNFYFYPVRSSISESVLM